MCNVVLWIHFRIGGVRGCNAVLEVIRNGSLDGSTRESFKSYHTMAYQ